MGDLALEDQGGTGRLDAKPVGLQSEKRGADEGDGTASRRVFVYDLLKVGVGWPGSARELRGSEAGLGSIDAQCC